MSRHTRHLWRAATVGVSVVGVFLLARAVAIPSSWGELGPFRGAALEEEQARLQRVPTRAQCGSCHEDVLAESAQTAHKRVLCKHCHGTGRQHVARCRQVADSGEGTCVGPESGVEDLTRAWDRRRCARCHQQRVGPPPDFPLVDIAKHPEEEGADEPDSIGVCGECHSPHDPAN